nr:ATP-grasp domain-containing protein [Actinomycetota bacterium]
GVGGTPPEFALPRLARHGDVHALLVAAFSERADRAMRDGCTSVRWADPDAPMPETIVAAAREVGADAVVAFSEFAIVAVAEACSQLGLRGPGPHVLGSRDKVEMRKIWRDAGLPGPAFEPVRSLGDLERAASRLPTPFLLKPTWLAGSQGQVLVHDDTDLAAVWRRLEAVVDELERARMYDFMPMGRGMQFVAEEIIEASTESWYEDDGYGDYVSIEGLVVGGRYHPISITGRLPSIPPYVELGFPAPSVLSEDRQRQIEELARAAVDALRLDYCATHTEIKLQRDRRLCLLENAARLGGAMVPRVVYEAFGVDLIDLLLQALLRREPDLPERMLTSAPGGRAVASLMLVATDSKGKPWTSLPPFRPDRVDWRRLTSPDTEVEVVAGMSLPSGSPMPRFSPTAGTRNYAGTLFLRASDARTLQADCFRIVDNLEAALRDVEEAVAV